MIQKYAGLLIGGALGTLARYMVDGWVYRFLPAHFPYGTFIINITGCGVLGVLAALSQEKYFISGHGRIVLMIGFCGAFTTFSTFIFETNALLKGGEAYKAFANVAATVLAGFLCFRLGALIGEWL